MKKDKINKHSDAVVNVSGIRKGFGDGGVIFSEINAEFPSLSECGGAEEINSFYKELSDRLIEYAAGELRAVGEREFSALGEGVARFRFRRLSLCHSFRVTYSDGRYLSIVRTLTLRRGVQTLSERSFGEVFEVGKGRFAPPESFLARSDVRKLFASEPRVKPTLENRSNFYTDGKRVIFLLSGERGVARTAELHR